MIILTLIVLVCITFYLVCMSNFNYWKNKNVPFAKPIPIFGNILPVLTGKVNPSTLIKNLHNSSNDPYLGMYILNRPHIIIRDIDIIKQILVKDFDYFVNRVITTSKHDKIGLKTIILLKDEKWRLARRHVSPLFTLSKLKAMFPLFNEVSDKLIWHIEKVANKQSHDCRDASIKYAIDVTSSCLFGIKANALEDANSKFYQETLKFFQVSLSRGIQTTCCFIVPQIVDVFNMSFIDRSSMIFMQQIFLKMLTERRESNFKRNDFIDLLNERKEADSKNTLYDENLACLALSLLAAGYETTGNSLSFLWYELSANKDVQQRLREEVQVELQKHKEFSYEAISKMKYLDMVVNESLRKYPILGFLDRLCNRTYKVPNTDLVIEKGTGVYISAEALHYDEKHFPNPTKFDPERFSEENKKSILECVYMPFGKGLRGCAGAMFGILSLKIAVAKSIVNFEFHLSDDSPRSLIMDPKFVLYTPQDGQLKIKFKRLNR